jgi:hypothetical protein
MENEGMTAEEIAAAYHNPVEAVLEAVEYVHENEEVGPRFLSCLCHPDEPRQSSDRFARWPFAPGVPQ